MVEGPALYARDGRVAELTLNRPDSGNAIDLPMAQALRDVAQRACEDDDAYVVLVRARGPVFCTGAAHPPVQYAGAALAVSGALAAIPKPTIALVQGDALGQGLELALACDLRLAYRDAVFCLDQVTKGLIPSDGGTQRLPRLIGRGVAAELILTGRRLSAPEALEIGLVSEVVDTDLLARGRALAGKLARMAPIAATYAKEAILKGMDMPLEHGLRMEADLALLLHSTRDRAEGLKAFLERRPPNFAGG